MIGSRTQHRKKVESNGDYDTTILLLALCWRQEPVYDISAWRFVNCPIDWVCV